MAELKATIRISERAPEIEEGPAEYQFEVDDWNGQPVAMGLKSSVVAAMLAAAEYVCQLTSEDAIELVDPTDEEYAAEVARAKVEFQKKQIVPRSGVR